MISVGHIAGWVRRRRAVRRRFNPYIAGTPVFDKHLFFGRQQLALRTLRLLGSQSVKLTGERRIGKTSFLYHLRGVLAEQHGGERPYFPVFVDLEAVTAAGLFHAQLRVVQAGVGRGRHAALDELELGPFTPEEAERRS